MLRVMEVNNERARSNLSGQATIIIMVKLVELGGRRQVRKLEEVEV